MNLDYTVNYFVSRGLYDVIRSVLPQNSFILVVLCLLIFLLVFSKR